MKLNDLFRVGKVVTIVIPHEGEPIEFHVWMRKPSAGQNEEALSSARAKQARLRMQYEDPNSDAAVAIQDEVKRLTSKTAIVEKIIAFDVPRLRQKAMNDVLYSEDEGGNYRWGKYGEEYSDIVGAIAQRMDEVMTRNAELDEAEIELRINFDEDPELVKLMAKRQEFEDQVEAIVEVSRQVEIGKYKPMSIDDLRAKLRQLTIDAEGQMAWYEEYRLRMLHYACRELNNKDRPYFDGPYDILDLPSHVMNELLTHYDDLDAGGEALKNLPSLQHS